MTTSAMRWIAAGKILGSDKSAVVACPEREDGTLVVHDEIYEADPTVMERYLVCDTCGARNIILMRVPPRA